MPGPIEPGPIEPGGRMVGEPPEPPGGNPVAFPVAGPAAGVSFAPSAPGNTSPATRSIEIGGDETMTG